MLKVLQFGRFDFNEVKGGVQFYAELLAKHSAEKVEIDQLVSSSHAETKIYQQAHWRKISVGSWGTLQSVAISPGIFSWTRKLVREGKYDLVHLNFPDPLALLAAFFIPKEIPLVVTWHSDIIRQKWALWLYTPLLRKIMKRARRIIVSTPFHLQSCPQLQALQMDEKVVVIPFGIEPEKWQLDEKQRQLSQNLRQQHQGRFLLLALGRHVYYKGFEYLLGALAQLPECDLILGGTGPLTEKLKQSSELALIQDRVQFPGLIPENELASYMSACDLFCFPSVDTSETFGYAQVEAMMCGKPVLNCEMHNGVNFVNQNEVSGLVVPPKNSDELAHAIRKLIREPKLREKMGQEAYRRAHELFLAQKTADQTLRLFEAVAKEGQL